MILIITVLLSIPIGLYIGYKIEGGKDEPGTLRNSKNGNA